LIISCKALALIRFLLCDMKSHELVLQESFVPVAMQRAFFAAGVKNVFSFLVFFIRDCYNISRYLVNIWAGKLRNF